jgi:hypothetical protein
MRDTFEIHDEIHVSRIGGAVEYRQRMAVREILLFTERLPVIDASRVRNFIDQIRNRQIVAAGGSRTKFVIFWGDFVRARAIQPCLCALSAPSTD